MAAEQISPARDQHQHGGKQQVIACTGPVKQHGVGCLVDEKAAAGDAKKAQGGGEQGRAMASKTEPVMACEGYADRRQPACGVGQQRRPLCPGHRGNGYAPMNGGRGAAHEDEPAEMAVLA